MRTAVLLFSLCVVWSGCLQDALIPCGTRACPAGDTCTQTGLCASDEQLAACTLAEDLGPCEYGSEHGYCTDGVCIAPSCGNGVVEYPEVCDDGNVSNNDQCNATCTSIEACGNQVVDFAAGEECDDGNTVDGDACDHDCKIPRCGDGRIDSQNGELCDDGDGNSLAPDADCRPGCQPSHCGDGVTDSNEACDDGNLTPGDHCSGDCLSTEVCGNHIVDAIAGEQCDDAHAAGLGADGCSSTCTVETDSWRLMGASTLPPERYRPQLVVDPVNGAMLFGGNSGLELLGDTWRWDGQVWEPLHPPHSPSARYQHVLAYDYQRDVVVMFGGIDPNGDALDDTWTWNGVTWTELQPAHRPSARGNAAMAYDDETGHIFLVGGDGGGGETWSWDGSDWTMLAATIDASTRAPVMAFDFTHDQLVLVGGGDGYDEGFTYVWNGVAWNFVALSPRQFQFAAMTWDPDLDGLVLYGGVFPGTQAYSSDVRLWNGSSWADLSAAGGNAAQGNGLAYDFWNDKLISFGGIQPDGEVVANFAGFDPGDNIWMPLVGIVRGGFWDGAATAYDPGLGVVLQFGGKSLTDSNAMFSWNGALWRTLAPAVRPPARSFAAMAHDEARHETVLFSGSNNVADTWLYNGAWREITGITQPPPRTNAAMAYDPDRGVVVLFGGEFGLNTIYGDIWEWNGTSWAPRTFSVQPSARTRAAMAYDRARHRMVLFGGNSGETWEYDGVAWTLRTVTAPPGTTWPLLGYDADRGRVILFGGYAGAIASAQTWEWDGTSWLQRFPTLSPGARGQTTMAYDAIRGTFVLYGGRSFGARYGDTWTYAFASGAAPRDRCADASVDSDGDGLKGCTDPDCWGRCSPYCAPGATCNPTQPHCGDAACDPVEDYLICPQDCFGL